MSPNQHFTITNIKLKCRQTTGCFSIYSIYCMLSYLLCARNRLQLIQSSAARVPKEHITPILKSLYWFPVSWCIDFKILLLVVKALHGFAPIDSSDMFPMYEPGQPCRSSGTSPLVFPTCRTKTVCLSIWEQQVLISQNVNVKSTSLAWWLIKMFEGHNVFLFNDLF